MAESILPGVYIDVRAEGLIAPGQITVGNLGVVGTAAKGEIGKPIVLGSYGDARQKFGAYDSFIDPSTGKRRINAASKQPNELTLVRALEQAFGFGATTVFAVRVAAETGPGAAAAASYKVKSAGGDCVTLAANSKGTWGNELSINIWDAEEDAFVEAEEVALATLKLAHFEVVQSARNRLTHFDADSGITRVFSGDGIVYGADAALPDSGKVKVNPVDGTLHFHDAAEKPGGSDKVTASYAVKKESAVKVTLRLGRTDEVYTAVNGIDLAADINDGSAWVIATEGSQKAELPIKSASATSFAAFQGGINGESGADYEAGLDALLNENAHIIVAAGQDDSVGDDLDRHCQRASTDVVKRDRIAVVGSKAQDPTKPDQFFDYLRGHNLASDRVIFVAPGIVAKDSAMTPPADVTLPGAYAAASVAGLLSSFSAHISPTNKVLSVAELERSFNASELTQLVQSRVFTLEKRQGFRIVKGITTSTNSAFAQVTTRRIVDFAKFSVRSAATAYIGLLNNERVRAALKNTIISSLQQMFDDEMLTFFTVEVTATRPEEIKGIARVTIGLQPTFSIDFIKVTMFLQ